MSESPLLPIHISLGARMGETAGRVVPRNYGEPAAEYEAVRTGVAIVDRADRVQIRAHGRDPVRMIQGLISNDVVGSPEGKGVYATVLTPKGRMIADLRVFRRPAGDLLLDVDSAALASLMAHLKRSVPPLFARFEELGDTLGMLGVYGPRSGEVVGSALGLALPPELGEDAWAAGTWNGHEAIVIRTEHTGGEGFDLILPRPVLADAWTALSEAGAVPIGHATLEVIRIEAGRPRWGAELDETTIPLEAGLRDRAISQTKGCYTGQEVIIRILHRGHVNWLLRGIALGDLPVPARGTTLVRPGEEKPVGRITSACSSPLHGETIALGYVRREVEPPAALRLGGPEGPAVTVHALPLPVRP